MLNMVKKYFFIITPLWLLVVIGLSSCNVFSPQVVVPCYGHIDSIAYSFNKVGYPAENSSYADITDAWVYVDDNPIGAFEMPCTFPIIATNGTHQVKIFPGVKEGGVSSARSVYTLYTYYTGYITLKQDSVVKMNMASVTYASFYKFDWFENFESITNTFRRVYSSNTVIQTTSAKDSVFKGTYSGRVVLDSVNNEDVFIGRSDSATLPRDGVTAVWLEINYNSNNMFQVGLLGQDTLNYIPIVFIYPTGGAWKKMYIPLESTIAPQGMYGEPYSIYFRMDRAPGNRAVLLLDNIKLVQGH